MAQSPNSDVDRTSGNHILIIDDDMYSRDMYEVALTQAGYTVETASDGISGYNSAVDGNFQVILLDIILPGLSGTDLLVKWRQNHPKGTDPRIIVLTNYDHAPEVKSTLRSLADGYLVKATITPRELRQAIASVTHS